MLRKEFIFGITSLLFAMMISCSIIWPLIVLKSQFGYGLIIAMALMAIIVFSIAMMINWPKFFQFDVLFTILNKGPHWPTFIFIISIVIMLLPDTINHAEEGVAVMRNQQYYIANHGEIVREISETEYNENVAYVRFQILAIAFIFFSFGQLVLLKSRSEN